MKTLEEVIKAFECCEHGEPDSNCEECSYIGIGFCCLERENDALYYLKEYQRYQNTPSRNGHMSLVDYFEASQKNEPLTWEELRTMEGEPIWIELLYHHPEQKYEYWDIIERFDDIEGYELIDLARSGYLYKDLLGKEWKAYRRG